jgi:hypothetical protein
VAALDAGVPLRDVQEATSPRRPLHHHAGCRDRRVCPLCTYRMGCSVSCPATEWIASGKRRIGGVRDRAPVALVTVSDAL